MAIEIAIAGIGARDRDWVREIRKSPSFKLVARLSRRAGFHDVRDTAGFMNGGRNVLRGLL